MHACVYDACVRVCLEWEGVGGEQQHDAALVCGRKPRQTGTDPLRHSLMTSSSTRYCIMDCLPAGSPGAAPSGQSRSSACRAGAAPTHAPVRSGCCPSSSTSTAAVSWVWVTGNGDLGVLGECHCVLDPISLHRGQCIRCNARLARAEIQQPHRIAPVSGGAYRKAMYALCGAAGHEWRPCMSGMCAC